MCFPHIVNIIAQHIIDVLNIELTDESVGQGNYDIDDEDEDDDPDRTSRLEAQPDGPRPPKKRTLLAKIRHVIRAIRASDQKMAKFKTIIITGNQLGNWKDLEGKDRQIQPVQFLRDCKTRWDSTYEMLIRFLDMKQVCWTMHLPFSMFLTSYIQTSHSFMPSRAIYPCFLR